MEDSMRIVIAGSSGFVGRRMVERLRGAGHQVVRLIRDSSQAAATDTAVWDPASGSLEPELIAGADAVINLCGHNIGASRWTAEVKQLLRTSRLEPTALLAATIAGMKQPPRLLVNASAVGLYGDRGDTVLDESAPPGRGFLADLVRDWEAAASATRSERTRVVLLRLAMVLGRGGALDKMLLPFRLGLGGPVGSGRQWWPWIALDDVIGAIELLLETPETDGPVNLVSPTEVRCRDFARTLGRVLNRPAVLPLPALAARITVGEMADPLLLYSARVRPAALLDHGYAFRHAALEDALRAAVD
jgi:uncharacterized protein (TIGR01777 family)